VRLFTRCGYRSRSVYTFRLLHTRTVTFVVVLHLRLRYRLPIYVLHDTVRLRYYVVLHIRCSLRTLLRAALLHYVSCVTFGFVTHAFTFTLRYVTLHSLLLLRYVTRLRFTLICYVVRFTFVRYGLLRYVTLLR